MSSTDKAAELSLEMIENQQITKQSIQKLVEQEIINKENTSDIVEILGGINSILRIYLSSNTSNNNISLTNDQLLRLHQFLTTPARYHEKQKNRNISATEICTNNIQKSDEELPSQFTYRFDVNDTVLHSICSPIIVDKIKCILDSKYCTISIISTAIIGIVILFLVGFYSLISIITHLTLLCSFWIPWMIAKHLLFNKRAFILCLKTFDYWIKVGYGIILCIAALFRDTPISEHGFTLSNIRECVYIILTVLAISFVASFDALNTSKTKKLIILTFGALVFSFLAVFYQFFASKEKDYIIRIQLTNSIISIQSLMASSLRIISLFVWKQTINTFRKKGKAASISCSPHIIWTHRNNDKQKHNETIKTRIDAQSTKIDLDVDEIEELNVEVIKTKPKESRSPSMGYNDTEEMNKYE